MKQQTHMFVHQGGHPERHRPQLKPQEHISPPGGGQSWFLPRPPGMPSTTSTVTNLWVCPMGSCVTGQTSRGRMEHQTP